jgi:two-component system LytT family response regulator
MTPMRALIVDDEPPARRRLRTLLKADPRVTVVGDAEDGPDALRAIAELTPDLIFLDVQMPGMSGFEVLEHLGPANAPAVIFVTAYETYALKAFDAHAVDYLLKPFDRARMHDAISRAATFTGRGDPAGRFEALLAEVLQRRAPRRLMVQTPGRVYFVNVADIDWIEAAGHYVTLHAGAKSHLIREAIGTLAERLDGAGFARIERGAIVNLDRVQELRPAFHGDVDVLLKNGTRLRASRRYAGQLQARLRGTA